jgi:hypothetical protein
MQTVGKLRERRFQPCTQSFHLAQPQVCVVAAMKKHALSWSKGTPRLLLAGLAGGEQQVFPVQLGRIRSPGRTVVNFRFIDVLAAIRDWWTVITAEAVDVCDFDPGYEVVLPLPEVCAGW